MTKRDRMLRNHHIWTLFHHRGWDTHKIASHLETSEAEIYNTLARMRDERAKVEA